MEKLKKLVELKKKQLGDSYKEFDSPFVPSDGVGEYIIEMAQVTKDDIFIDVGCGDGRILLEVFEKVQCKCIGIEIDPVLIEKAHQRMPQQIQSKAIEVIQCDFKSDQAAALIKKATVFYKKKFFSFFFFWFIFVKKEKMFQIMPVVTDILSKNLPNEARICCHTFPLRTILNNRKVEVNDWPFISLGIEIDLIPSKEHMEQLKRWYEGTSFQHTLGLNSYATAMNTWNNEMKNKENIIVNMVHPLLKANYSVEKYCQLIQIGDHSIDSVLASSTGSKVTHIQRFIHNYLSQCQQSSKSASFVFLNPPKEIFYTPNKVVEINKNKKNTTIKSDLMLYLTPLKNENVGWKPPNAAVRIT
ncbi:putative RNA methylase [Reticulomyxa filosa]|uniref:Putative RNA methylase n=1 Tax=Reticulomyxa filosa TaxID=46433 RepID=X6M9T5_RETFI|nr:putative RNA methylase [Reticulomyxa filosa]|eukprot:ETO09775.1 putative RNA methylase [Reticulomyxa filosa]